MGDVQVAYAVTHVPGIDLRERVVARQRALLPDIEVIRDPDRQGVWPTTVRAYERLEVFARPGTTHVVVLQDDMAPCGEFRRLVEEAVDAAPEVPVSLFSLRRVIRDAREAGRSWALSKDGAGPCTVLPAGWVRPFLDWARGSVRADYKHDDRRLMAWLIWTGRIPVWHTVPSLVEHVAPSESLLGNSNRTRLAAYFDPHVEQVDWSLDPFRGPMSVGSWLRQVEDNLTEEGRRWLASR